MHPGLLLQKIDLLLSNDTPRAADPYVAQSFPGGQLVVLHDVTADQYTRPSQPCLAMDRYTTCSQSLQ